MSDDGCPIGLQASGYRKSLQEGLCSCWLLLPFPIAHKIQKCGEALDVYNKMLQGNRIISTFSPCQLRVSNEVKPVVEGK